MMFSWPVFFVVVLGVLQLAFGIVIGRMLVRGRFASTERLDAGGLSNLAYRLHRTMASVVDDVGIHRERIERLSQELKTLDIDEKVSESDLIDHTLKAAAKIMVVNERLQNELSDAENRLQSQTRQIASHLNEARTDPLTGLPNRRAFDTELDRRLAEWKRKGTVVCLLMVDADRFKKLNDRHGHQAGDHALCEIANVMEGTLRTMDLVARIGGEEFAAVLPSTNAKDGMRAAERVRAAIEANRATFDGVELPLTISLGLSVAQDGDDSAVLVKRADEALYASKRGGRNCSHFHNGNVCELIARGDSDSRPAVEVKAEASGDDLELEAVYDGPRSRLDEITDES